MYNVSKFNLGREALRQLIQLYKIKKMYIPYYLCDVVRHTLVEESCKPVFYHIDNNFFPDCEFNKNDYVLYPNYWGICEENVKRLVNIYSKLIVDNAHAYYDKQQGFACFNAGHKFGYKESYLWIKSDKNDDIIDIIQDENKELRKKIFLELHKKYSASNLLNIDTNSIPFIYPYLAKTTEEADKLVKQIKGKGKMVYRYWSPLPKSFNEYKFYSRLVPIPILPLS